MLIKLMVLVLIAAFVGLFFIKGPNGQPIMTLEDFKPDMPDLDVIKPAGKATTVYKWKDENGVWQFSSHPVEVGGQIVETMELDGNINTFSPIPVAARNTGKSDTASGIRALPSGLTTVSLDKIADMMDTVNGLQETVDKRKAEMDKIIGKKN